MKKNILRINYNGNPDPNGNWWKWDEICDRCGKDCEKSVFQTMQEPNTNEEDFCLNCLRELLDERR